MFLRPKLSSAVAAGGCEPRERTRLPWGFRGKLGGDNEHLLRPTKSRGFRGYKEMFMGMLGGYVREAFHPLPKTCRQHSP
jgi:hypothetical protein